MNAKSPFSYSRLTFPKAVMPVGFCWSADRGEHRGQGHISGSGYELVPGPKASEGTHRCRTEMEGLIALLLLCGVVGTAVSGCASFKGSSFNPTHISALSSCPGQEGYPDCQPN
jgi:hypothetical protein